MDASKLMEFAGDKIEILSEILLEGRKARQWIMQERSKDGNGGKTAAVSGTPANTSGDSVRSSARTEVELEMDTSPQEDEKPGVSLEQVCKEVEEKMSALLGFEPATSIVPSQQMLSMNPGAQIFGETFFIFFLFYEKSFVFSTNSKIFFFRRT